MRKPGAGSAGFCFALPFPTERRHSSFGLTEVKRRQYLCSNSTRQGEPLRNSLLVLRQMLGNLLIRGRVLSAFAGRKNTAATFSLHQLGSECYAQPHGCVSQRAICMSKENSFQRQQSCCSAWQSWEMRGNKPGCRDRSPPQASQSSH